MDRKIKVLMFGWEFPPTLTGGVGMACYGLTRHLALENIDITFVLPHIMDEMRHFFLEIVDGSSFLDNLILDKTAALSKKQQADMQKFNHEHINDYVMIESLLTPYSSKSIYYSVVNQLAELQEYGEDLIAEVERYSLAGLEVARQRDFDIVHVHDWMSMPVGIRVKQLFHRPLIVHLHTSEYDRHPEKPDPGVVEIEQQGFLAADKIIVVSHGLKQLVVEKYKIAADKIEVVYNAVERGDTVEFDSEIEVLAAKKVVLFLGRITSQKGPMLFLDAAEQIIAKRDDILFVMAGDGDMAQYVIRECQKRELQDYFFFPGHLQSAEKEKLFAVSDLYVLPSLAEPFGITPAEVMQYNIPILMTEGLAAKEIIPEAEEFSYNDPQDLASKIITILASPQQQKDIIRNYHKNLDRLDWRKSAQKTILIYQKLLDQTSVNRKA